MTKEEILMLMYKTVCSCFDLLATLLKRTAENIQEELNKMIKEKK